jgi:ribosomal protein S18 acetylase RimI-like enzyme
MARAVGRASRRRVAGLSESQARGQGVGSLVLEKVQGMACERQLPRVRLTVFKSNRAQHLYLRRGFRKVGEDDCFYRMERTVSPKIE